VTTTIIAQGGAVEIVPHLVLGYETTQTTSTQIHLALGASFPGVTLRPALARSGTLSMLFKTETKARDCRTAHAQPDIFTLTTTDLNHANMYYVPTGDVTMKLDDTTYNAWIVEVGYQEVGSD
jgi:hypothetical protein